MELTFPKSVSLRLSRVVRLAEDSAATGSERKIAKFLSKICKIRKDFFGYTSCYPGKKYFSLFNPFFNILGGFLNIFFDSQNSQEICKSQKDLF